MKTATTSRGKATAMPDRKKYISPTAKFVTTRRVWQWDGIEYKSVEQEGYWYDGEWTLVMNIQPTSWDTDGWQFRNDDGSAPENCTTAANENTTLASPSLDTPYHLQFAITNTGAASGDVRPVLQFRIDSGSWANVTTSSTGVAYTAAANAGFPADEATYNGTAGLTTLAGTSWHNTRHKETINSTTRRLSPGLSFEWNHCIQFIDADLSGGETIEFRYVDAIWGDDLPDNNNQGLPTVTIASAGGGGLPAGSLALLGAGT